MEVLPCTGVTFVAEPDCHEPVTEAVFKHDMEQASANCKVGLEINSDESDKAIEDGDPLNFEKFAGANLNGGNFVYDGQNTSFDSEDDNFDKRDHFVGPDIVLAVDTIESELSNNNQDGSSHSESKTLEQDEPQAAWVKWRGNWQAGIRCARADWPLSTLRAKPTHGRKQYLVIYFPRTRNYSWADVLLIRPIDEYPHPIAYKSHDVGVKMVKDLMLARRFIMQKLSVSMLNILDQLHPESLAETVRNVIALKEFAMEASRCKDYSDLGKMLLKLQKMILDSFLDSEWLQQSLQSWMEQCQNAKTAETIELLKEELESSISWNEVNSLSTEAAKAELGADWKSWKHEVLKWFSVSHPIDPSLGSDPLYNDTSPTTGIQTSRKRAKLEVRRADTHASSSYQSVPPESIFNAYNANTASLDSENRKMETSIENAVPAESPVGFANKWDNIIVEPGNTEIIQNKHVELSPANIFHQKLSSDSGNHNRQCVAFIEAKGRQCVRYANEGGVYCCVHLASSYSGNSARAEATPPADSPMCGGTTVLGTKCKHRALVGTSFCKKHRPQDGKSPMSINKLKRKNDEIISYPEIKSPPTFVSEHSTLIEGDDSTQCIGTLAEDGGNEPCLEIPKRHSLYCEKHIPSWLKRARNGKSRIVSKEVFIEFLNDCNSREKKLQLHQACELFYKLFKSVLSLRNPGPMEAQFQWAISEASKDVNVGEFLTRLVTSEKERLKKFWGFGEVENLQGLNDEEELVPTLNENSIKCKYCPLKFFDENALGKHWMDNHKKEAQWLFRGYVCGICLDSFTNKKLLKTHVQDMHNVQFVEQCMLIQCMLCRSQFGNTDQLWGHVLATHPSDLRGSDSSQEKNGGSLQIESNMSASVEQVNSENQSGNRRYVCRFCGLKFDLLPDLGRHHQAAHMEENPTGPRPAKKGIQFYAQRLKSGRLTRPGFRKILNSASYKIRNRSVQNLKKRIQASNSVVPAETMFQSTVPKTADTLGRLEDSQCLDVAKILFSEIKKTKSRPTNSEILSIATSSCCKINLQVSLEAKYGVLPEKMYLRAAKLCSENGIVAEWHQEGYICPRGCVPIVRSPILSPAKSLSDYIFKPRSSATSNSEWTMEESHCVLDSRHFSMDLSEKNIVLCDDISLGQEPLPIACVMDENLLNDEGHDGPFPWESFKYVVKPLLDKSLSPEVENKQLACCCAHSVCFSGGCDHVYLFDNDYEDAKDIYGKGMRGRFPYDERGRIILEEGYLVYECNQRCSCTNSCQNRVLQNGVQKKLEIFKTEKKGWAVRSREAILRGSFVCEYIGEVIDENEANERQNRNGVDGRKYFYEVDGHINDISRLIEGQVPFVIDSTNYGNVSRFINHSCSPNLVNHQVLVESMDSQLAHIGFFASRDIAVGEELTYNFRYKLLSGDECPCLCGASNCRGRLY